MTDINDNDALAPFRQRIDVALQTLFASVRAIADEAYELGRTVGRDQAYAQFRHIAEGLPAPQPPSRSRALRGSMRPLVLRALANLPHGASSSRIAEILGANKSSVRGTLNRLAKTGEVIKTDDNWLLADLN